MLSILNPRYSFLEADYEKYSLAQIKQKDEIAVEKVMENGKFSINASMLINSKIPQLYQQAIWKLASLVWIPVDIFCIAYLAAVEVLS